MTTTTNPQERGHTQLAGWPPGQPLFWQIAGGVCAVQAVVGLIVLATASVPVGERLLAAGASGLVAAEITAAAIARRGSQWGRVLFGFVAAAGLLTFVYPHGTTTGIGMSAIIYPGVTFGIVLWFYIVVSEAPEVIADLRGVAANLRRDNRDADRDRGADA